MSTDPYENFTDEAPADRLTGMTLAGGWRVMRKIIKTLNSTGGNFSTGYIVIDAHGEEHFLKAIDFVRATRSHDPARAMQAMVATFNFERDILQYCKEHRMGRVVTAVHEGSTIVKGDPVQYLIFELAKGDVRNQAVTANGFPVSFAFRTLHEIAIGLNQMHQHGVAHQDLKPSNVLLFDGVGSKLADLGRAVSRFHPVPHEELNVAGDRTYAPVEHLYRLIEPDWVRRRCGCDAYLLGSMTAFMFTGTSVTSQVMSHVDPTVHWMNWRGTFAEALPHLQGAFAAMISELAPLIDASARSDVLRIIRELCNPDPSLRGHPRARRQAHGNPLSLERYISEFDRMAIRASISERVAAK